MKYGSITTGIIADGLVFNMDAANRASTIPSLSTTKSFNTIDTSISGSFINDTIYDSSTITPSFAFDGTNDFIDLSSLTSYSSNDPHTYSAWINATTLGGYKWILNNGAGGTGTSLVTFYSGIGFFWKGGGAVKGGSISLSTGTWYNLTVCYHGSSLTYNMYVNGVLDTSSNTSSPSAGSGTTWNSGNSNPRYGAWHNGSYDWNGNIGPLQVYNRSLSSNEVLHNYNALKGRFGLS